MRTPRRLPSALLLASAAWALARISHAEGIPEPGIVFYGTVENSAHANGRLTVGSLNWTVTSVGSAPVTVSAALANLAGTNSYRLRIPYETIVGGNTAAPGAFLLNSGTTGYSHASIQFNAGGSDFPASIVGPALAVYNFSAAQRGVVQRLNLRVNAPGVLPSGGVRLQSVGAAGSGGGGGTGEVSTFQFTSIAAHPEKGIVVQWTGAPKDRSYFLLRAQTVESGLSESEVVKVFSPSPAVSNSFWDTNTVNTAAYFYQLLVQ
jgi:hypothetical protein